MFIELKPEPGRAPLRILPSVGQVRHVVGAVSLS